MNTQDKKQDQDQAQKQAQDQAQQQAQDQAQKQAQDQAQQQEQVTALQFIQFPTAPTLTENDILAEPKTSITNPHITKVCDVLFKDEYLSFRIHQRMKNILQDGKINEYDVPEIALMLADIINTQPKLKLTADDFPIFVALLFDQIMTEYNLLQDNKVRENFKRLLDSSIKLLLMQPNIKAGCNSCFSKLSNWLSCF